MMQEFQFALLRGRHNQDPLDLDQDEYIIADSIESAEEQLPECYPGHGYDLRAVYSLAEA